MNKELLREELEHVTELFYQQKSMEEKDTTLLADILKYELLEKL